jgi:hypothetical protein
VLSNLADFITGLKSLILRNPSKKKLIDSSAQDFPEYLMNLELRYQVDIFLSFLIAPSKKFLLRSDTRSKIEMILIEDFNSLSQLCE